eukprot:gb/GECH01006952.1/.p1 GENE.gb/GECH01006952.1/~~gb/GECH01006952.1/.p1  ORF type:complete len:221 (+),score=41.91 gb/GECH01006952.1/:1-663(+)
MRRWTGGSRNVVATKNASLKEKQREYFASRKSRHRSKRKQPYHSRPKLHQSSDSGLPQSLHSDISGSLDITSMTSLPTPTPSSPQTISHSPSASSSDSSNNSPVSITFIDNGVDCSKRPETSSLNSTDTTNPISNGSKQKDTLPLSEKNHAVSCDYDASYQPPHSPDSLLSLSSGSPIHSEQTYSYRLQQLEQQVNLLQNEIKSLKSEIKEIKQPSSVGK